ncbi:hypothetical protein [Pseudohalioglobus lutimaris]|uniref:Uncharacterized protein n=1 Tax=Pseudohalioglobus lutimaris TaxID=1737061 RepID=A0A2N5X4L3_9GAMM|nr:hypothetical protein [Pseudohalioglobus lutimaris]PLW69412.1 hypothetical protein C0039_07730 [Pseudohalioglobus lutimaris]
MSWRLLAGAITLSLLLVHPVLAQDAALLDVGVVIFDPGVAEDVAVPAAAGVFPEIRRAESRYLPVSLRRLLEDTGEWGVVRVLPHGGSLSEVLVEARILESTGQSQRLDVVVTDATGRVWLQREYQDQAQASDYPVPAGSHPFIDLYRELAADLLAARQGLTAQRLRDIRRVALMRYAADLSPEAFASYLSAGGAQPYQLQRLPARDDPMIERVMRIRNQEYLFIDNVDEQYGRLHDEMAPTYALWLQYDREQSLFTSDYTQRAAGREKQGKRGSFAAMQQNYYAYRSYRLQQQGLEELATGFNNETAPTLLETQGRVFRLTGTLDNQYAEWRGILREIFALEMGLPAAGESINDFATPPQ